MLSSIGIQMTFQELIQLDCSHLQIESSRDKRTMNQLVLWLKSG